MLYYIDVILPIPLEKLFTYSITEAESNFLKVGMRVAVPFGKTKIYTAIVVNIHTTKPLVYEAKEIHQILDESPIVLEQQLKFWAWISSYYMCTLGDVMRAALPSAFMLESETFITKNHGSLLSASNFTDDEYLVLEALQHQSTLKIHELSSILNKKNVLPVIKKLVEKEVIKLDEEIYEKYKPKLVRYIKLHSNHLKENQLQLTLEELSRAPKQKQVVMTLFMMQSKSKEPIKVEALVAESQASSSIIKTLIDKSILEEYFIQTDRINYSNETEELKILSEDQTTALTQIESEFKTKSVVLFYGVTSSGKTEVYVKLIEEALQKGEQVLYLLPEIALTTQLVNRLKKYFGDKLAVFHSKYTLNERVEVYNNVLHNSESAQVILGARSSVFLPFNKLGLIIVDEEHEQSYKQFDPAPRYHARDSAVVLAHQFSAKILLGSATPSLESYNNAKQNKYGLVTLKKRYNNVLMPEIELIDVKDKHKRKLMKGHFSDRLILEMQETLEQDLQIILFQNRRGFAPIIECTTCGEAPQCPNCDVSLTYHQYRKQLRCHYCSYTMAMLEKCMACKSSSLDSKGFGTEQIEEEVKLLFPNYKVARMDLDTTRGKYGYEKIITAFEQQEVQILVGTQMLTKGLDFRNVKLVGIMNADNMLNFPDFRAHERSFQLIQQVSGRAGRTGVRGKVLIQTFNPYHKILQQVSENSYSKMFNEQLQERYDFKYPPFFKLLKITFKHRDYNKVEVASDWFAKALRQTFKQYILGPEFPAVSRVRNMYLKNVLVKIPQNQSLAKTKEAIYKIKSSFEAIGEFKSVRLIINVDNY
ncbi:primosomal protein N' [Aurantibacter sp.]|uniref:replication restart helicase PriA n=1 Tax=Aurantibacter sp. TaxID=2807103 RepID=UPI0035C84998